MNKYIFHVSGTHCASCKILIEDILDEQKDIQNTKVDLLNKTISFDSDLEKNETEFVLFLNEKLNSNGYFVSIEKNNKENKFDNSIFIALPVGILFLILFFLLQKSGILNFNVLGETTPVTSFIIGLIASVSSCLAIVGGLVLSLSAKISEDKVNDTKTFLLFHSGRLISFGFLGGVLGALGGVLGISFTFTTVLGIIASLVMILLGLNLLGILNKNKLTLPSFIFKFFKNIEHKTLTPLIVGLGTFFLPCGFTQSMQVVALSSGSFLKGFLIMFAFALGTLPMLLLLSFGSASFSKSQYAKVFFASAD
jgi:sulfite exporter TauE/SafE/copper chaperone CopZ